MVSVAELRTQGEDLPKIVITVYYSAIPTNTCLLKYPLNPISSSHTTLFATLITITRKSVSSLSSSGDSPSMQ